MNKAPKVLTRMRLSCCWGDNLNEKELNDVVDYINGLEQQVKKQKEVIDKAIHLRDDFAKDNLTLIFENNELISFINNLLEILEDKEV